MLTSDFDFHLPPERIASQPPADRAASRMLVVHRATGQLEHRQFLDLPAYIQPGDEWVLNDTRVIPARYFPEGGGREILRLTAPTPTRWRCMVKPGKKFRLGAIVHLGSATGTVAGIEENGDRWIEWDQPVDEERHGHLALPHYMGRPDNSTDRQRYQTVFAREPGSIAAPTAGLHFTPDILAQLPHSFVTLHVGVGTFQPVRTDRVEDHVMHAETYEIPADTATRIRAARRVVAVGTTALRTLETVAAQPGGIRATTGSTDIFIYPGYTFRCVQALLTNFHLPKSTLLMLVSAFSDRDLILHAYAEAVREDYRFFSYGDCMLIL